MNSPKTNFQITQQSIFELQVILRILTINCTLAGEQEKVSTSFVIITKLVMHHMLIAKMTIDATLAMKSLYFIYSNTVIVHPVCYQTIKFFNRFWNSNSHLVSWLCYLRQCCLLLCSSINYFTTEMIKCSTVVGHMHCLQQVNITISQYLAPMIILLFFTISSVSYTTVRHIRSILKHLPVYLWHRWIKKNRFPTQAPLTSRAGGLFALTRLLTIKKLIAINIFPVASFFVLHVQ